MLGWTGILRHFVLTDHKMAALTFGIRLVIIVSKTTPNMILGSKTFSILTTRLSWNTYP